MLLVAGGLLSSPPVSGQVEGTYRYRNTRFASNPMLTPGRAIHPKCLREIPLERPRRVAMIPQASQENQEDPSKIME